LGHLRIAKILHPSPASPTANCHWSEIVTEQLLSLGFWR
jgi:single-strand selective monofunctional uracil DNA glycosylase